LWVADYFHEFRDLFAVLHQWERQADAARTPEYEAARPLAHAKSEAHLAKRLQQYETAQDVCEQAMARYDQLARLLHLLRAACHVCTSHGRLRTQENVRSEPRLLCDMIQEIDCAALAKTLTPVRKPLEALLVPVKLAASLAAALRVVGPHDALDRLVLAWHHDHLISQAGARHQEYHQRERDFWLACAAGLLGDALDALPALVFDKLDALVRAASLLERLNGLIRPYRRSCQGQMTPEALNLIRFYHNHRRYKSGKRQGKAPIELLTGEPLEAPWWELFPQHLHPAQGVTAPGTLPSRSSLHLVVHNEVGTDRQARAQGRTSMEHGGLAEKACQQADAAAAEPVNFCWKLSLLGRFTQGVRLRLHLIPEV
jgi:hypothetical protein